VPDALPFESFGERLHALSLSPSGAAGAGFWSLKTGASVRRPKKNWNNVFADLM